MYSLVDIKVAPGLPGEIYISLTIMLILLILCVVVFFKARRADPLKPPKGILFWAEILVEKVDNMVLDNLGPSFLKVAPYFGFITVYLFTSFMFGMFGFPNPMSYYLIPLSLAIGTFFIIQVTSVIYNRFNYIKKLFQPVFVFFPLNVVSLFTPIISLSLRLFANAIAGWVMMYMVYSALSSASAALFNGMPYFIAPFVTPALHLYFDVFSGYIQTTVFVTITMLLTANEIPDPEEKALEKVVLR